MVCRILSCESCSAFKMLPLNKDYYWDSQVRSHHSSTARNPSALVRERIYFKILLLTFNALNNMAPAYLKDLLRLKTSDRYRLRPEKSMAFIVQKINLHLAGTNHFILQHIGSGTNCLVEKCHRPWVWSWPSPLTLGFHVLVTFPVVTFCAHPPVFTMWA